MKGLISRFQYCSVDFAVNFALGSLKKKVVDTLNFDTYQYNLSAALGLQETKRERHHFFQKRLNVEKNICDTNYTLNPIDI
jgi:MinD-like ATPase involved in chromosome partitioning or flagellar assembly